MISLLGPQRFRPTVCDVVREHPVDGPVALVTAGWQERELEDQELTEHLGCETLNLEIYRRYDEVMTADKELFGALRRRQDRLQAVQRIYRRRLRHQLVAARDVLSLEADADAIEPEREDAIANLRRLDAHQLKRIRAIHREFEEEWHPRQREGVARQRRELTKLLRRCPVLCIAGGHVAVLLNRIRLFGFRRLPEHHRIVAWSAGAMALTPRVILFHDYPPQGPGDPEVLDEGLNLCPGLVALPHAARRLRLGDPTRVSLFTGLHPVRSGVSTR